MNMRSVVRIAVIAVVCRVGSTGVASVMTPFLPLPAVDKYEGHRLS
jgi:hypothetical protein